MGYQLEIRHLRYFLAVAEELHFGRAANRLFISQPGLSRQIKQLESNLGVQLFERNNKKVALTKAGGYLKTEASLMIENLNNVLEHVKMLHEGEEGTLNISYVGSAMQNLIPRLLVRFRDLYPNIHFNLKEIENAKQIEGLLSHKIDVGFVRLNQVPDDLMVRPVWKENFCIVVPADHPINSSNFHSLLQFEKDPFILFEKGYSPVYFERVMSIFEHAGFSPIISHSTVHANTIFRLVEQNFGVSIIPTSLQLGYQLNVRFIELNDIPQQAVLSIVWNKKNRNPILQKMLSLVEEEERVN